MPARLDAVLDHVAVAVPDRDAAMARWADRLGGGLVGEGNSGVFASRQLRLAGGGKVELIAPSAEAAPDTFMHRFLRRFGTAVHHVTLKVPDLLPAVELLRAHGVEAVDVQASDAWWREAFLRPSQVGGLVVQVAWSPASDREWAQERGHPVGEPAPAAARLLGPRLRHPDLAAARALWTLLGADVTGEETLTCRWPGSALTVEIVSGEPAGPIGLRMEGTGPLAADPVLGPEVLA